MSENNKIQASVYQIDLNQFDIDQDFDNITKTIIQKINNDLDEKYQYNIQRISQQPFQGYKIKIFHAVKTFQPRWKSFLADILDMDSNILKAKNTTHSYICFIGYNENIFAITGGSGSFAVDRFTVFNFGLELIVRIFEKDSKVIKATQNREVTGSILGQSRFFRGDQRFSDNDQFGAVYKMVKAELNYKRLTKILGFSNKELKKDASGCLAKSSFQLNKSIDFPVLLRLIKRFDEILKEEANFPLNKVLLVNKKNPNGKKLHSELFEHLKQVLYNDCITCRVPDFDFCHKEYEKFFTCAHVKMKVDNDIIHLEKPITLPYIIERLKKEGRIELNDVFQYNGFVLNRQLRTYDENGELLTSGSVLEHIHGEVTYKNQTYFLIDGDWYRIHSDFIKELNEECKDLCVQSWEEELITEIFDSKLESEFNKKFIGRENFLVFDGITPDNIEACDILKYDNQAIHLIHVKQGFKNSMRDLTAQVFIAAKRIKRDIKSGYNYITDLEMQTKKGKTSNSSYRKDLGNQSFPVNGLKSLFQNKQDNSIVFCLAFVDTGETERCLKDNAEAFESSIAKFSLIELRKQIIGLGFQFKIIQLRKNSFKV